MIQVWITVLFISGGPRGSVHEVELVPVWIIFCDHSHWRLILVHFVTSFALATEGVLGSFWIWRDHIYSILYLQLTAVSYQTFHKIRWPFVSQMHTSANICITCNVGQPIARWSRHSYFFTGVRLIISCCGGICYVDFRWVLLKTLQHEE